MKTNKEKALEAFDEYLRGKYKLEKLFDAQLPKTENITIARQMFIYLALEFGLKETFTEMRAYIKDTYDMSYSLRSVIYSANAFSDKVSDSISLQSQYKDAKQFLKDTYVKAR